MIYDELSLGPTPCDETCQQVGTPAYEHSKAREECRRFIELLKKVHGEPPEGASYHIKSNPHDFGTYLDVVIRYDADNDEHAAYAYKVEANCPTTWDGE